MMKRATNNEILQPYGYIYDPAISSEPKKAPAGMAGASLWIGPTETLFEAGADPAPGDAILLSRGKIDAAADDIAGLFAGRLPGHPVLVEQLRPNHHEYQAGT